MTAALLLLGLLACEPEPASPASEGEGSAQLPAPRLLRRLSLDLRGTLPSAEELDAVEADPAQVDALRDAYLEDALFEERLVHLFAEVWHTRGDTFDLIPSDFGLDNRTEWYRFSRSVGEEPLRLMAHIAATDQPWTAVVTADHTMADARLGEIFPLVREDGAGEGWAAAWYVDGRPPVGVLATNGLWWRYPTDSFNLNRTRAAAIARLLLCDDYLLRPGVVRRVETTLEDTDEAIRSDPSCLTCHASLDPLAASMFGFWWVERYNPLEAAYYHPEREGMGEEQLGVQPAWFGVPVDSFAEVGLRLSRDDRFSACAVRTVAEGLLRRPVGAEDYGELLAARRAFEADEMRLKAAVRAITDSEEYRAAAEGAAGEEVRTVRLMTPDMLEASAEALVGAVWADEEGALIDTRLRAMAGGVDGRQALSPQLTPSLTTALVARRLAQRVAGVAADDLGAGLLAGVSADAAPGEAAFDAQLGALRWQLHGRRADADWLEEHGALWTDAAALGGSRLGWQAVLSALMQDPDYVGY